MSLLILKILIVEFLAGAVLAAWQRDWAMTTYYLGAMVLNAGILFE